MVSEAGAMNVFFLLKDATGAEQQHQQPSGTTTTATSPRSSAGFELVTPPLDGTILPGVTRASLLSLAAARSASGKEPSLSPLRVTERPLTVSELSSAASSGRLLEVFCSGTAAAVMPVQSIARAGGAGEMFAERYVPGSGASLSSRLFAELQDIQYGRTAHDGWSVRVDADGPA